MLGILNTVVGYYLTNVRYIENCCRHTIQLMLGILNTFVGYYLTNVIDILKTVVGILTN